MLQRQKSVSSLIIILAAMTVWCTALPAAAAHFAGAQPVSNAQLASLRGGFAIGSGRVRLSFGIRRLSFINGKLAAVTQLDSVASGGLHVIQNGPGNFVTPSLSSTLPAGTLMTVIQNSLDGQTISNLNVFDITISSVQAARSLSMHNAVVDALARGM